MKFSQFTQLMRQHSRPDKEQIRKKVLSGCKPKWIKPTAIISAIVITVGIIGAGGTYIYANAPRGKENHLPDNIKPLSTICAVTAEGENDSLPTDSTLKITTQKTTDVENLKNHLRVTPYTDYTLKKTSGNTFDLTFNNGLDENTLYKVSSTIGEKEVFSWAFQTESEFKVTGHSTTTLESPSHMWIEFSHSDVQNLGQYFSVTPTITGEFEQYGNRWLFTPSSSFADGTVYTVTISADTATGSGKVLGEDYSFNFISRNEKWCDFYYSDDSVMCDNFTEMQTPAGKISYSGMTVSKAAVDVYSIESAEEYIFIHKTYVKDSSISDSIVDVLNQPLLSFETETLSFENDSYAYFGYPQKFTAGRYISVITINGCRTYHFFQVNNTAVYPVSAGDDTAIWLADTVTNSFLSNIAVTSDGDETINTDSNGIVTFKGQSPSKTAYYTVGTVTPYVCITSHTEKDKKAELLSKYQAKILTDKTNYKAKDAVKINAFTVPIGNAAMPENAQLYCSWNNSKTNVGIDANGVLTQEFLLSDTVKDNGYIDLIIDGVCIDTAFINFDNGITNNYNVTVKTDKPSYIAGESVEYTFFAEFADKIPAQNVVITSGDIRLVTDSEGFATFSEQASDTGEIEREFTVTQSDRQTQIYANYTVYKNGYFIKDVKDFGTSLSLIAGFADGFDDETDTFVTLELHRVHYQSEQNEKYFDPVAMQTQYTLRSYAVDEIISTRNADYDTKTPIPYTIPADNKTYYMRIIWGESVYDYPISSKSETLIDVKNDYMFVSRNELSKGDALRVSVLPYDENKTVSGKVMVCAIQNGIQHANCYDPASVSFEFTGDTVIAGAYFDGKAIHPIESKIITQRKYPLDVSIETEKTDYLPGETVNRTINVMQNGAPQKAHVNISVTSSDFSDSVFFDTITTDIAGKASFSFKLPEQIGNYTITACAINSEAYGQAIQSVNSTKDFYITPFVAKNILSSDDFSFAFKINATPAADACNYTLSLSKDGILIQNIEGTASYGQLTSENLEKLDAGHYQLTISAEDGVGFDSITREFDVTEHVIKEVTTTGISNTNGIIGDKKVHLYDRETEIYFSVTDKMLSLCNSSLDNLFARQYALNKMGIEEFCGDFYKKENIMSSPENAALLSALMSEQYDTSDILSYFDSIRLNYPTTKSLISAYLANAAHSMPVLDELNIMYKQADSLTDDELLYLSLAYSYAGDSKKAWDIIDRLSPNIRLANGTATFAADTPAQSDYMSCLAAIAASRISHTHAKELVKGLINGVECDLLGFAYFSFAEYYVAHLEGENTVLYKKADGSEQILTYNRSAGITLTVIENDYNKISFESVQGETLITLSGLAPIAHNLEQQSAISQSVEPKEISSGTDFVITVDIDVTDTQVKSPYAAFTLPHGIKLKDYKITDGSGKISVNGNNVDIYFTGDTLTAQFTCFGIYEGSYTLKAPALIDRQDGIYMSASDCDIAIQ